MLNEFESRSARMFQSKSKKLSLAVLNISLMFLSSASLGISQEPQGMRAPIPFPSDSAPMGPVSREAISNTPFERQMRAMEVRSRVLEMQDTRHKLQSDAGKLLSLAADLQAEIGTEGRDSLTPTETKKLAEIQKLAHRVKSKLRDYAKGF
jgi:hypothetical protein